MTKKFGILLPLSSVPTREPVGNIGLDAYRFLEFLKACGATHWQMLPIHPVDEVFSPYSAPSAFAGETAYIDIKLLDDEELTDHYRTLLEELPEYETLNIPIARQIKLPILREYYLRNEGTLQPEIKKFQEKQSWALDYALFEALKVQFGQKPWTQWPEGIRLRDPHSVEFYGKLLGDDVSFFLFLQYLFFKQWNLLKKEAKDCNITLIGDIPIYVPLDSADVWTHPSLFELNENLEPLWVSGAPPDYFTPLGQKWNTPVYRWPQHQQEKYAWWTRRIRHSFGCFQTVRLDHFRGFESFWAVSPLDEDARNGHWMRGPGMDFLHHLKQKFPASSFIVEDLGDITPEVEWLKAEFAYPGMKVLQFAFDGNPNNPHLPLFVDRETVYYTGTHDNAPLPLWFQTLEPSAREMVNRTFGPEEESVVAQMIKAVLNAPSALPILQFQDLLEPSAARRINTPGTVKGNWIYKVPQDLSLSSLIQQLHEYTKDQP